MAEPKPYQLASFGARFGAYLIDLFLMTLLVVVVRVIFMLGSGEGQLPFVVTLIISMFEFVLWCVFDGVLTYVAHGTLGMLVVGIRVAHVNGKWLQFWPSFGRVVIARFMLYTLFIGYFVALKHPMRQGWHDRATDADVIRRRN